MEKHIKETLNTLYDQLIKAIGSQMGDFIIAKETAYWSSNTLIVEM